jgi:hypothetical protein
MWRYPSDSLSDRNSSSLSVPLCDIIDVDPQDSRFTCVGYAHTTGKRCQNKVNQSNRQQARLLLQMGEERLNSGESLHSLLTELAPRVLCLRRHQNQASSIVPEWSSKVSEFRSRQTQERTVGVSSRRKPRLTTSSLPDHSTPRLGHGSPPPRSENLRGRTSGQSTQSGRSYRRDEEPSSPFRSFDASPGRPSSTTEQPHTTSTRSASDSTPIPRISRSRNANPVQISTPSRAGEELRTSLRGSPSSPRPSPSLLRAPRSPSPRPVTRKPIEGDCNICYISLDKQSDDESDDGSGDFYLYF